MNWLVNFWTVMLSSWGLGLRVRVVFRVPKWLSKFLDAYDSSMNAAYECGLLLVFIEMQPYAVEMMHFNCVINLILSLSLGSLAGDVSIYSAVGCHYFCQAHGCLLCTEHCCPLASTKLYCLVTETRVWTTCPDSSSGSGIVNTEQLTHWLLSSCVVILLAYATPHSVLSCSVHLTAPVW